MSDREFVWETVRGCADPWVESVLHALDRIFDDADETERQLADMREALAACGKHLEDCCRTDIGWPEQMRSHDEAVRAVAKADRSLAVSPADTTEAG